MQKIAKIVIFSGTVQGVGFRYTTYRIAKQYEIAGYVKNLPSGQVELFVQGDKNEIENIINHISEYFQSYIKAQKTTPAQYSPKYSDFTIEM